MLGAGRDGGRRAWRTGAYDLVMLAAWLGIGASNFAYCLIHVEKSSAGAFVGAFTPSFLFLALTGAVMLATGVIAAVMARARRGAVDRLRATPAFRCARVLFALFLALFLAVEGGIVAASLQRYEPGAAVDGGAGGGAGARAEAVVVLGAHVRADGGLSNVLKNRLDACVALLREEGAARAGAGGPVVVVTGGQGPNEPTTEAQAMRDYLVAQGVPEGRVIVEDRSANTFENFAFSKRLMAEAGVLGAAWEAPVVVVTSGFHMLRAKMLAARAGLRAYGYPARTPLELLPSYAVREFFGVIKSFFLDK
jgi:uncharacterized SAM-binding protein YcdF (DUF218 family)